MLHATAEEEAHRDAVVTRIREYTASGKTIRLDRSSDDFVGRLGPYCYLFEGEEDLLHLEIRRADGGILEPESTGEVARYLLGNVPEAMIWMKPGERAHHYFLGQDLI